MPEESEVRLGSWNRASLVIRSDRLTPDQLSDALLTQPSDSGAKGTQPTGLRKPLSDSFWCTESGLSKENRIEDHLIRLLEFIENKADILGPLVQSGDITIR